MTPDSMHSQEVGIQEKLGWVPDKNLIFMGFAVGWSGPKPVKAEPPKLVAAKATPGRCQVSQHILGAAMSSIL